MQYSKYYEENLYPFQDKVLRILKNCDLPFYLTGGTAVSRGYLNHRYSDDLDLFVNNDPDFQLHIEKVLKAFDWKDIIDEANQKEAGIDLKEVVQIFCAFSDEAIQNVKWTKKIDIAKFRNIMNTVSLDMLKERKNSLCS